MKELTSVNNPVVKDAADLKQKKNRAEQNAFLVEGLRSVEEAVSYGTVRQLFVLAAAKTPDEARMQAIVGQAAAAGADLYSVSEQVMKKIADTETPQALTAVVTKQTSSLDELTALGGTILVLDRIGDPGNLGTMIRTPMLPALAVLYCCQAALMFLPLKLCAPPWARCCISL